MKLKIQALDTLTFGVGKPSVWGEDTFGAGRFPPFPLVLRGAVRASWLYEHAFFEAIDSEADLSRNYVVSESAVLLHQEPHFPVPADYLWSKEANQLIPCRLKKCDGRFDHLSSLTTPDQLWPDATDKLESAEERYLPISELNQYLNGQGFTKSVKLSDYITDESKIGIYRDHSTHTAKKNMLYRSPLIRLGDTALVVNISGVTEDNLIRFGGENKVAHFIPYDGEISPSGAIGEDGTFKLYLATPGIFKDGYEPTLPAAVRLMTAAVYGYDNVGGYDMKKRRPKPIRRAVKAGSVYYYKLVENNEENRSAILALHGKSISDEGKQDGFGICYIGKR